MEEIEVYIAKYGHYLEEIRKRIYRIVIVYIVAFLAGLFSTNLFVRFFITYLNVDNVTIVATSPFQLLDLAMSIGFFLATIVTIPFAIQQIYSFLSGGLLPHERRIFFTLIPLSVLLFLVGFTYGFGVMYYAVEVIAQVNVSFGITNLWNVSHFISQMLITAALLGMIFEFPIMLTLLIRIGLFPVSFLRRKRRIAMAAIFVFVALLPPTDGLSFMIMSLPLVGIYELTIVLNSFYKRKEPLET
ncbi:MAG: sec-independent protein translocase protein TatC [Parcubacteria bacterium C7867-004]|nr:MAG: sec-independent protein translocase protein TatC [Parcubacteria bacterium C7867-004]